MLDLHQRVKVAAGEFKDHVGRVVGYSAANEVIVELEERGHECVHFPEGQLKVVATAMPKGSTSVGVIAGGTSSAKG